MDMARRDQLLASMVCGECRPRSQSQLVIAATMEFNSVLMGANAGMESRPRVHVNHLGSNPVLN
jgi:hypothetical protein